MAQLSVVVGRFQSPVLTNGHLGLLQKAREEGQELLVFIGSPDKQPSKSNPLPYEYRRRMVERDRPGAIVLPLDDNPSDSVWMEKLELQVALFARVLKCDKIVYYSDPKGFISVVRPSKGEVKVFEHPGNPPRGTDLRRAVPLIHSTQFAQGAIWAMQNQYPIVSPTVDIACIDPEKREILLIAKHNEQGWRLPGGFVDLADENYLAAARREFREECGPNVETSDWRYFDSFKVKDWRLRGEEDRSIVTTVFTCLKMWGYAVACDDADEVGWFPLASPPDIVPEHTVIIERIRREK